LNDDKARSHDNNATVLGAGPAGTLMAIFLAQRGYRITLLERLPDQRRTPGIGGRSINLALADRGIHALRTAGVLDSLLPHMLPMRGRMLHAAEKQTFLPYGQDEREVIYSVARAKLNETLLDHAERKHGIDLRFRQTCISVDNKLQALSMQDLSSGRVYTLPMKRVIGADGAGSVLRRFMMEHADSQCSEDLLAHGYKELTIAADAAGKHRLAADALHIWPRGEYMLIALPNTDGTFTATIFLPYEGAPSFSSLNADGAVEAFFQAQFPDVLALIPDLARQFAIHPTGLLGTVRCDRWTLDDRLALIGDAAHAIVPFHGQGMNCALEDCVELDALLGAGHDWSTACGEYERRRKPNADAIADMALENYVEMRDTVRDPQFQLQKHLSLELERRFPKHFIPRYSMVMFHHEIPYATAFARGKTQQMILQQLTANVERIEDIDYQAATQLIESTLPAIR
jgi:kynurenine 3-monooxygenase